MILLDTNVALYHANGSLSLPANILSERLYISSITRGEVQEGLQLAYMGVLERGASLVGYQQDVARVCNRYTSIPFGNKEAETWALLNAQLKVHNVKRSKNQKMKIKESDMMIAATALHHGLKVVTSDKSDFTKIKTIESTLLLEFIPVPTENP